MIWESKVGRNRWSKRENEKKNGLRKASTSKAMIKMILPRPVKVWTTNVPTTWDVIRQVWRHSWNQNSQFWTNHLPYWIFSNKKSTNCAINEPSFRANCERIEWLLGIICFLTSVRFLPCWFGHSHTHTNVCYPISLRFAPNLIVFCEDQKITGGVVGNVIKQ